MKTSVTSRKILPIASLLAGALLVLSPAIGSAFASNNFSYTNPGERAFVNVTNNADNSTFTIVGAFFNASMPLIGNYSEFISNQSVTYIGANATGDYGIAGGNASVSYYTYFNGSLSSGYYLNSTYVNRVLNGLGSVYLITGAGNNDNVSITNGLTSDIYSVVTPGNSCVVSVTTGTGSSTYAIQVGTGGSITIKSGYGANDTYTASTNVFNIVYGNTAY